MSKRDVSPKKKNQENNQKSQIKLWFSTKKENQDHNEKRLLYVTHQKKSIHSPILLRHLDVSRKKNQTQIRNRKSLIVHHPKNTRTLELELPKNYPKMPKPLQ